MKAVLGYGVCRVKLSQVALDAARARIAARRERRDAEMARRAKLQREQEWLALYAEMSRYADRTTAEDRRRAMEIAREPMSKRMGPWIALLDELKARPEPRPALHWAQR